MRTVAILAFDGVVAVDLVLPADTFSQMRHPDGKPGYRVKVCGVAPWVESSVCRMHVAHGLSSLRGAETIIVPGIDRPERDVDERLLDALRRAAARGVRIASVCSGALVLARTGLLDGKRATTHWAAADALRALHPRIEVDESVLYIDHGRILTSAGGMAQLDLCLHMIRTDYGAAAAATSARTAVMPLERHGGQSQYIVHAPPSGERGDSLSETLEWMQRHLGADLTSPVLARRAAMSERTFARRFREQTGTTPAKWVTRARITRAQTLLETTALSVEHIAEAAGFGSPVAFRERFKEVVGVSPSEYRKTFRGETHG